MVKMLYVDLYFINEYVVETPDHLMKRGILCWDTASDNLDSRRLSRLEFPGSTRRAWERLGQRGEKQR